MSMNPSAMDQIFVLLVEDDERLASLVSEYLTLQGAVVSVAHDGLDGLEQALAHPFDAVLLDLMLPKLNGLDVCVRLRERSDVPILMITAADAEGERIVGLESGADDYICKPFSTPELVARIRAIVRRRRGIMARKREPFTVGALDLDPQSLSAKLHAQPLVLTVLELELLVCFAQNEGKVLTREQILDLVHGSSDSAFDRSIDGHISRLRRKLGDDPRKPAMIKTVRGAGYLFVAPKRRI